MIDGAELVRLYVTDRHSAGDEHPPKTMMDYFHNVADEVRKVSPLAYVVVSQVDEWATMTVRVRVKPRQPQPALAKDLGKEIIAKLPESIRLDNRVTYVGLDHSIHHLGCVAVKTTKEGRYDFHWLRLYWDLEGNLVDGWRLKVQWGEHTIERPAKFKKLTAGIILQQLAILIGQLIDPLDGGDWRFWLRNEQGSYKLDRRGDKLDHDRHQVFNQARRNGANYGPKLVQAREPYDTAVFSNLMTNETFVRKNGDDWPRQVDPLRLDEKLVKTLQLTHGK